MTLVVIFVVCRDGIGVADTIVIILGGHGSLAIFGSRLYLVIKIGIKQNVVPRVRKSNELLLFSSFYSTCVLFNSQSMLSRFQCDRRRLPSKELCLFDLCVSVVWFARLLVAKINCRLCLTPASGAVVR